MPKNTGWAVSLLGLTLVLVLVFSGTARASDIVLNDLESKPVNLSLVTGKLTILFFWTTWCPYCRTELKELNGMRSRLQKEGVDVFAVNVGEPGYKVERFLKNYSLGLRVLLDLRGRAAQNYDIKGVPTYVFINRFGDVAGVGHSLPADYMDILSK